MDLGPGLFPTQRAVSGVFLFVCFCFSCYFPTAEPAQRLFTYDTVDVISLQIFTNPLIHLNTITECILAL